MANQSADDRNRERAVVFGRELRLARARANLYQSDLAAKLGRHATSISQWESGARADVPSEAVVRQLDTILETGGHLLLVAGYLPQQGSGTLPPTTAGVLSITPKEAQLLIALADRLKVSLGMT